MDDFQSRVSSSTSYIFSSSSATAYTDSRQKWCNDSPTGSAVRNSYATKSNQHRVVKTPGGKLVYQTTKKRASGPKCPCHWQENPRARDSSLETC
ncbi:hypothetical protein AAHA92_28051 [Salvia divinorum]|uniref:Uncharacterized protein n=1 Tax=Salvia divinorum TaxID=28513 RepID=A0ABD1G6D9_SALDI